jgi:oligopeptide/dipeptide ABC transporter ATP-binding protein
MKGVGWLGYHGYGGRILKYLKVGVCNMALLEVKDLKAYFFTTGGIAKTVDGVSFEIEKGQILGLVGESGSGKTTLGHCLVNLLPKPAGRIIQGQILFNGEDLAKKSFKEMRKYRGDQIAMIVQDPMSSLDPMYTIGNQISEAIKAHHFTNSKQLHERVIDLLEKVRIPAPRQRIKDYPHQFSGGMRQRVVGAAAISCHPKLLIADEPTTSLDVTIQAQYLALLRDIQEKEDMALLFITHDLGIVAYLCTDVAVMYAGKIVEIANVRDIFKNSAHPYTRALINSVPHSNNKAEKLIGIGGVPPRLVDLPLGCAFAPRCTQKIKLCETEGFPPKTNIAPNHHVHCWRYV